MWANVLTFTGCASSEHGYSQTTAKLRPVKGPRPEGLGYLWQHCSPPGRLPAAFKVFIMDSWLVTTWLAEQLQHLSLCHRRAQHPDWLTLQPTPQGSTYPRTPFATTKAHSSAAVTTLLSLRLMPNTVRLLRSLLNLCGCPSWKLVLSSKGLVPSHSGSLLPPSPRRMTQTTPLKDAVLKNPGWVWLWEKDQSSPCCRCCFAVVFLHSCSLLVFN